MNWGYNRINDSGTLECQGHQLLLARTSNTYIISDTKPQVNSSDPLLKNRKLKNTSRTPVVKLSTVWLNLKLTKISDAAICKIPLNLITVSLTQILAYDQKLITGSGGEAFFC